MINPDHLPARDEMDRLRTILFDSEGWDVLIVRVDPENTTIIILAATLNRAKALGNGSMIHWQVQGRAYSVKMMIHARGYSNVADIQQVRWFFANRG